MRPENLVNLDILDGGNHAQNDHMQDVAGKRMEFDIIKQMFDQIQAMEVERAQLTVKLELMEKEKGRCFGAYDRVTTI